MTQLIASVPVWGSDAERVVTLLVTWLAVVPVVGIGLGAAVAALVKRTARATMGA